MYETIIVQPAHVEDEFNKLEKKGFALMASHIINNKVFAIFHKSKPKPKKRAKAKPRAK